MVDVVRAAVLAIERRDWDQLKTLFHPYLRWTCTDGQNIRGRKKVLAHLEESPPSGPPSDYELRDRQIYRWIEPPTP
jgi:hypothetical protein